MSVCILKLKVKCGVSLYFTFTPLFPSYGLLRMVIITLAVKGF